MLGVIGTSFTVEYGLKGLYEGTAGRIAEYLQGTDTDEDRYAARVAQDYGNFVENRPFYEYSFAKSLGGLWKETSLTGPHALRKWERKAWLSLDYAVEALYCLAITFASHSVYGVEDDVTWARIESANVEALTAIKDVVIVDRPSTHEVVVKMPRYQKFTEIADQVIGTGAKFLRIAGNEQIMVTAVVDRGWTDRSGVAELLFAMPILSDTRRERVALRVPVAELGVLRQSIPFEHVYDY